MMPLGLPGAQVEGWLFEYWPRRAPTFTLRIYEPGRQWGEATLVRQFTIRNPAPAAIRRVERPAAADNGPRRGPVHYAC